MGLQEYYSNYTPENTGTVQTASFRWDLDQWLVSGYWYHGMVVFMQQGRIVFQYICVGGCLLYTSYAADE